MEIDGIEKDDERSTPQPQQDEKAPPIAKDDELNLGLPPEACCLACGEKFSVKTAKFCSECGVSRFPDLSSGLFTQPIFKRLQEDSTHTLIIGIGGGYDLLSGIPMYYELKNLIKARGSSGSVSIANLSFVRDLRSKAKLGRWVTPVCVEVSYKLYLDNGEEKFFAESKGYPANYFPEWHLSKWFWEKDKKVVPVFTFDLYQCTVASLTTAMTAIVNERRIDTMILCDSGVDSLLKHDERQLGTVGEDLMSILAARSTPCAHKYLMTLGLGTEGGISEDNFYENWAEVQRLGGFLGSLGFHPGMPSCQLYIDAWRACVPENTTINTSIVYCMMGAYGTHYPPECSRLCGFFAKPLAAMACFFDLNVVCKFKLFMHELSKATTLANVQNTMGSVRKKANLIRSYRGPGHRHDSFAPHESGYKGKRR